MRHALGYGGGPAEDFAVLLLTTAERDTLCDLLALEDASPLPSGDYAVLLSRQRLRVLTSVAADSAWSRTTPSPTLRELARTLATAQRWLTEAQDIGPDDPVERRHGRIADARAAAAETDASLEAATR